MRRERLAKLKMVLAAGLSMPSERQDMEEVWEELEKAWRLIDVLRVDKDAYQQGLEDGRRGLLGPQGEGEVWTVELTAERVQKASGPEDTRDYWTTRSLFDVRRELIKAISEGRCSDPRACCALLV